MPGTLSFGYDGDDGLGDRLVDAVLRGVKTATSSLLVEYRPGEPLPVAGERLMLTDSAGRDRGTVETTGYRVVPLPEVGDDVAAAEGEGYADAADWRRGHLAFWDDDTPLIREEIGEPGWSIAPDEAVVVHFFRLVEEGADDEGSSQPALRAPSVELVRVPGLAPAVPYSYASLAPVGARLMFLAGVCPLDEDGSVVPIGDLEGQARQVLQNLRTTLAVRGCGLRDVLHTRVLVASSDRDDLGRVWQVVHEEFGSHEPPSTLLGVTVLGWPDQLVEVEAARSRGLGGSPGWTRCCSTACRRPSRTVGSTRTASTSPSPTGPRSGVCGSTPRRRRR